MTIDIFKKLNSHILMRKIHLILSKTLPTKVVTAHRMISEENFLQTKLTLKRSIPSTLPKKEEVVDIQL